MYAGKTNLRYLLPLSEPDDVARLDTTWPTPIKLKLVWLGEG